MNPSWHATAEKTSHILDCDHAASVSGDTHIFPFAGFLAFGPGDAEIAGELKPGSSENEPGKREGNQLPSVGGSIDSTPQLRGSPGRPFRAGIVRNVDKSTREDRGGPASVA